MADTAATDTTDAAAAGRRPRPRRWPAVTAGLAAAALAAAGVAGCTGSSSSDSGTATSGGVSSERAADSGGSGAAAAAASAAPAAAPAGGTSSSSTSTGSVAVDVAAAERSRILTATVTERVTDVGAAVAIASGAAAGAGGYLGSATTTAASGPGTAPTANLVLRVPNAQFDAVLGRVSAPSVGKVISSAQTESDVTGQVADLASRLATQEASLARVRVLFAKATSVGQVVALESALTDRESTLESLQAQQRALSGEVDDATISLTLLGPGVVVKTVRKPVNHDGFVSGLHSGWHALSTLGRGVAVTAGALLPFAPVAVVLAGLGWWLARRRPRHDPPTTLPASAPPVG